jgi:hypothetical protein
VKQPNKARVISIRIPTRLDVDERQADVTICINSNGTALMETIVNENMVTIYHPDDGLL